MVRDYLEREFAAACRGRKLAVVMFGFPDFEQFSELRGSSAADEAVVAFGDVLERMTRRMNLSARCGWRCEAFLSVLAEADASAARAFVGRVQDAAARVSVPLPEIHVGIAVFQPYMATPDELIAAAEKALARDAERDHCHVRSGLISTPRSMTFNGAASRRSPEPCESGDQRGDVRRSGISCLASSGPAT